MERAPRRPRMYPGRRLGEAVRADRYPPARNSQSNLHRSLAPPRATSFDRPQGPSSPSSSLPSVTVTSLHCHRPIDHCEPRHLAQTSCTRRAWRSCFSTPAFCDAAALRLLALAAAGPASDGGRLRHDAVDAPAGRQGARAELARCADAGARLSLDVEACSILQWHGRGCVDPAFAPCAHPLSSSLLTPLSSVVYPTRVDWRRPARAADHCRGGSSGLQRRHVDAPPAACLFKHPSARPPDVGHRAGHPVEARCPPLGRAMAAVLGRARPQQPHGILLLGRRGHPRLYAGIRK